MEVRRSFTKKLGTHYGLYAGSNLIHIEYSRSTAEDILDRLQSGEVLAEILHEKFKKQHDNKIREVQKELEKSQKELVKLNFTISNKHELKKRNDELNKKLSIKYLSLEYDLDKEQASELARLIFDMSDLGFTLSSELSNHITRNNLGKRYPNISGIVTMKNNSDTWSYPGGFSKYIYRIVCQELDLRNNGSSARAVGFQAYKFVN